MSPRKWRPARSSTSTIQTSGSKRISRVSRSSTLASGAGCGVTHAVNSAVGRMRFVERALRRRAEQLGGAVEPVELDEDRAGLLGAAAAHRREGAFDVAAADIGRDPDRGFETHRLLRPKHADIAARFGSDYSSGRPVTAASSRATRSDAWPVTGSLRSRSNFSIAAWVSPIDEPGRLDLPVAVLGERALHGQHALGGLRTLGDRSLRTGAGGRGAAVPVALATLTGARRIACSNASVGSGEALRPAACSKSRIARVGLRPVEAVDRAVVEAAARQLALDVGDDLARQTRGGRRGGLRRLRSRRGRRLGRCRRRQRRRLDRAGARAGTAGGAAISASAAVRGFAATGLGLNIGAGCGPDCSNSVFTRMATIAQAQAATANASRLLKPSAGSKAAVRLAAATALFFTGSLTGAPAVCGTSRSDAPPCPRASRSCRDAFLAIDRQVDRDARALAQPAGDLHAAAVQRHQALDDREAEPGAVVAAVVGRARLEERIADARQILGADADAGILDRDHDDRRPSRSRADRRPCRRGR